MNLNQINNNILIKYNEYTNIFKLEINDILNQYIIQQDDAKKILSVAVYNHYKRLKNYGTY